MCAGCPVGIISCWLQIDCGRLIRRLQQLSLSGHGLKLWLPVLVATKLEQSQTVIMGNISGYVCNVPQNKYKYWFIELGSHCV